MKKIVLLLIAMIFGGLYAQDAGLGIGTNVGEPLGLSAKYWLNNQNSIEATLGYSYLKTNGALDISAVYNYTNYNYISIFEKKFHFNYGLGFSYSTNFAGNYIFGVKTTAQIFSYILESPTDYYFNVSPILGLFPKVNLYMDVNLGIRYYLDY
jgi:hypothetical protein